MVSKVQLAKSAQGYRKTPNQCNSCKNYTSDKVLYSPSWTTQVWEQEKNKRCGIGGFAVNSTATCDLHERGENAE